MCTASGRQVDLFSDIKKSCKFECNEGRSSIMKESEECGRSPRKKIADENGGEAPLEGKGMEDRIGKPR